VIQISSFFIFLLLLPGLKEAVVASVDLAETTVVLLPARLRRDDVVDKSCSETRMYRDTLDYSDVVGDVDG
jgi:hypothetical protein